MNRVLAGGFGAALAMVWVGCAVAAPQRPESSWKPLVADVSRAQLFTARVSQANAKNGKAGSYSIPGSFQFPFSTTHNSDGSVRQAPAVFGIDISHYDGANFPLSVLKSQNVAFVYMKATQGTDFVDPTFAARWQGMLQLPSPARIPRGAYHFLSSSTAASGQAQADAFVDYVNLHGGFQAGDLPPSFDLEWDVTCPTCADRWKARTPDQIVQTAVDFIAEVKRRTGRTPVLYSNKSFLSSVGVTSAAQLSRLTAGAIVWIFDVSASDRLLEVPNPAQNLPSKLWQFTPTAKLSSGYSGQFDGDVFLGTAAQFQRTFLGN